MRCQKLFEKGCIGGVEIRNRVAMTAMGNGLASWDGEVSLELIRFYEDRARGGCGLIFTEFTRMDETSGACNPNQLCIATRKHILNKNSRGKLLILRSSLTAKKHVNYWCWSSQQN